MTLDELQHYLDSDANVHGLDSIATHGFLVATVVGKPLPNWMSLLFEGEEGSVTEDVKEAINAWRDDMIATLKNEESITLPIDLDMDADALDFSPDSEISAWSVGFVDAMYGDATVDWFAPNPQTDNQPTADEDTSEDVAMLTLPMMVFSGIDMADDDDEDEELAAIRADNLAMAQMADSLERNVTELFLLFNT